MENLVGRIFKDSDRCHWSIFKVEEILSEEEVRVSCIVNSSGFYDFPTMDLPLYYVRHLPDVTEEYTIKEEIKNIIQGD